MNTQPSFVIPSLCPRCGNKKFLLKESVGRDEKVVSRSAYCTVCLLSFTGLGWEDQTGEDWVMAESGT